MAITTITPTGEKVLFALHKYRYLTPAQMIDAGACRDKKTLYDTLRRLTLGGSSPLGKMDYGSVPKYGRLPVIYFLTLHGARLIADMLRLDVEEVRYAKTKVMFHNDYMHRRDCVDFHIALENWAESEGAEVPVFDVYFDHTGANRSKSNHSRLKPKTKLQVGRNTFVPDGIFEFITADDKRRLCAFEMSRNTETKKVFKQLEIHIDALLERSLSDAYDYEQNHRIVWVFDTYKNMQLVQERAAHIEEWGGLAPALFFKTLEEVKTDFLNGWHFHNNENVRPLI